MLKISVEYSLRLGAVLALGFFLVTLLSGCSSLLKPQVETDTRQLRSGQYVLDLQHASVHFQVGHLGLSNYVGRFNRFEASLDFDPEQMQKTRLQAIVYVSSVDSNDPQLEDRLRGSGWFDTETYPQAVFTTESAQSQADGSLILSGILDWRDRQQPVELRGRFLGGAQNRLTGKYTLGFSAQTTVSRAAFGVDAYPALVGDQVTLMIEAEFQRTASSDSR